MSKKYKEGELGRFVSEEHALANKATTMAFEDLHPFTQAFENVREGEKGKAEKILKNLSDDEVEQFYSMLNDLFLSIMTRKKLIEGAESDLKKDFDEWDSAVSGEVEQEG